MDFCVWAPWVFSALAGLAGWLFRAWYDDRKIDKLNSALQTKDQDIFHLHEAHNLLLHDKEKKLGDLQVESDIQKKSIEELKYQLQQSEKSAQSLLSTVVEKKILRQAQGDDLREPSDKLRVKAQGEKAKVASKVTEPIPFLASTGGDDLNPKETADFQQSLDKLKTKAQAKKLNKKKNKKKRKGENTLRQVRGKKVKRKVLRAQIQEQSALISKLQSKQDKLKNKFAELGEVKEIVKEIPVTITRTIRIKEIIDRKKLHQLIDKVPFIKTKKKVKEKKKKGKVRIVKGNILKM